MRHLANLKRRLAADGGFALIVAMFVLLILSVLVATAIAVASQTSTSTTRDTNSKAALEAAEAGLQVARLSADQARTGGSHCITGETTPTTPTLPATGEKIYCTGSSKEPLGNGATFQYWTSTALKAGIPCGGATAAAGQRCITSEGNVNGITTRSQVLVASAIGEELFPIQGIVGLKEVSLSGKVEASSIVASNEKITSSGGPNDFMKGYELCPGGKFEYTGKIKIAEAKENEKNLPYEKTRASTACPIKPKVPTEYEHATSTNNSDSRITNKEDPQHENRSGAINFTGSSAYELKMNSKGELTLEGSKYYFCNLVLESEAKLFINKGAQVEIYIDSHAENHNCPENSGKFEVVGNAHIENASGADDLLIDVAGKGPVAIANSGSLSASIYAPKATVNVEGNGKFTGPVLGEYVNLKNSGDIYNEKESPVRGGSAGGGTYERKSWE